VCCFTSNREPGADYLCNGDITPVMRQLREELVHVSLFGEVNVLLCSSCMAVFVRLHGLSQTGRVDVEGILLVPVLTALLAAICYAYARMVRHGRPLTSVQKRMVLCACIFAFGMGNAIVLQDLLASWSNWGKAWIGATVAWGLLVALAAWLISRQASSSRAPR
jgi:hypothetical protein